MSALSLVMMGLGLFRFGVNNANYQTFKRDASFRWEKLDRVGRSPALQFMGPDADQITLNGVIYPHYKGGLRQVELMRMAATAGEPFMLVDGLGGVWERWAITSVAESKSEYMAGGAPRRIEFSVGLQAYGGDLA